MSDTLRGALYGLTAAAIWGVQYVVSDVVLHTVPPFTLLTIRLIIGALVLAPLVLRQAAQPTRREIVQMMAVGFVGFGISVGAQFVGTDKSTAVNGTLVTSASPAFILLFAALILRERLTMQRIGAVLLATIGVIVIVDPAQADFGSQTFAGNVVLAFAALSWGLYSVLVRKISGVKISGRLDTLTITFFAFLGGLVLTIPATVLELPQRPIGEITPGVILGILYLGTISAAGAMWLWNRSFALVDASLASLFFFAQPLVGTLMSVLLLNQQMTASLWIGSILIGGGLLLSIVQFKRRTRTDSSLDTHNETNNVTSNGKGDKPSGEPGNLAV